MLKTDIVQKAILINPEGNILLLRRSETDKRRPFQWDFPGGLLEENEEMVEGIIREVKEETGLDTKALYCVFAKSEPSFWLEKNKKQSRNVVRLYYKTNVEAEKITLSDEHSEYCWISPKNALDKLVYPRHKEVIEYLIKNDLL